MKGKNEAAISKEIIVLGATINKPVMPKLFRLATANKAALEQTVSRAGLHQTSSVMAMLESSLE